jgi:tRNA uridine 5-carboxymethylaminomethyl modification enzyme
LQITPTGCIRLLQFVEKRKREEAKGLVAEAERARRSALGVEKI